MSKKIKAIFEEINNEGFPCTLLGCEKDEDEWYICFTNTVDVNIVKECKSLLKKEHCNDDICELWCEMEDLKDDVIWELKNGFKK